jgi:hypothetical protein
MAEMTPGGDRTAKWNLKYDPDRIQAITTAGKPTYLEHASSVFNDIYAMEISVKQVLNSVGVSVAAVADYLCFGREMWSKCKTHAGETMKIEAATLIGKWVARGLTLSVLESIRTDVFNVGPPSGP